MGVKTRKLITNFSKGELSPLIEGRPDLAAYFEGGLRIENWTLLRQGGLRRRPGLRFIAEVKDSSKDTLIFPFEFSVDDAFVVEVGDAYFRFYKNRAQLTTSAGGPAVEVVSPYTEAQLRNVHFTQSADVLFLFHELVQQRRLNRVSDTNWTVSTITANPPPSFEADTDVGTKDPAGTTVNATLTPGATTGASVVFTASAAVFLEADVGRQIISGASRAIITDFGASAGDTTTPNDHVRADILDDFPSTNAIAAGDWFLRLSPQSTLDPDKKEPVGAQVTLQTAANAFREADVGKFIFVYDGLVKITSRTNATTVLGELLSVMSGTADANPTAAPAGTWTLEVASWSAAQGFPRSGEFFQGRLYQISTTGQKTTIWGSVSDDFDSYAVGAEADNAVEHTLASRQVNRLEWIADNIDLFIGTTGSEHRMRGSGTGEPIGGDVIPLVERLTTHGCAPIQPVVVNRQTLFLDRDRTRLFSMLFDIRQDGFDAQELTVAAEHITGDGIRLGPVAFQRRRDPRLYMVREDGELIAFTFLPQDRVVGFTRYVTDGTFEGVAVIPRVAGGPDEVWVVVKRTINGQTKRYVEMFEESHDDLTGRKWKSLQTDSSVVVTGSGLTTITGADHLEGKTVDVIADGGFRGQKTVVGGQFTLDEAADVVEYGLPYDSDFLSMRPAIEGTVIEGLPRSWDSFFVRLQDSIGGTVNSVPIQYEQSDLGSLDLFTGDRKVTGSEGWDTEARFRIQQTDPYPMTVLCAFGTLSIGDTD